MTEADQPMEELLRLADEAYHRPPATPREEMWRAISARLEGRDAVDVIDLGERASEMRRTRVARPLAWAVAAAAVLVLGIGIGRMTAPGTSGAEVAERAVSAPGTSSGVRDPLQLAALDHFNRTEALLTMVRADAREGRLDPATGAWARGLLTQTRLLMDARGHGDDETDRLLEDLELVLAQIVGVAEAPDSGRARTELDLTLKGMEEGAVLPRIHAALPVDMAGF